MLPSLAQMQSVLRCLTKAVKQTVYNDSYTQFGKKVSKYTKSC